jgi:RNA polymerase sigma factor (sigma-70 family)
VTELAGRTASDERLHAEIARGQRLDRDLARDLGRPTPDRGTGAGGYVESLGARPILLQATERRLVQAAKHGDATARSRLVEAYMPLISATARTYRSGQVQRVELLQEGVVGLLRALERFDPDRGIPFWGYATWWVRQAMQQLVSELTRPVVLSDRALRHLARLKDAHRESMHNSGRQPSRAELAERTLTESLVKRQVGLTGAYPPDWRRSERFGAVRLESPDRCVLISLSAPAKAADAARLREDSIAVLRKLFDKSSVRPEPPSRLGGAPTTGAVMAGRKGKRPPVAVHLRVSRGKKLSHLTEVLFRIPPCEEAAPQTQLILDSLEFKR